jgi:hypothetical protein
LIKKILSPLKRTPEIAQENQFKSSLLFRNNCTFLGSVRFRIWQNETWVSDPHHFNADPDPAFHLNADLDPSFHFIAVPDPDPDPHQGDANLRQMAYGPSSRPTFLDFTPPF